MKWVFSLKRAFVPKWGTFFNTSDQLLRDFKGQRWQVWEELFKPNEVDLSNTICPLSQESTMHENQI